jgi:hypothetical protein
LVRVPWFAQWVFPDQKKWGEGYILISVVVNQIPDIILTVTLPFSGLGMLIQGILKGEVPLYH